MAAFTSFHHNLESSIFHLSNSSSTFFPHFHQPGENTLGDQNLDHSTTEVCINNNNNNNNNNINEGSDHNNKMINHSMDSSLSIVTQKHFPMDTNKKRKSKDQGSSPNCAQSKDMREVKGKKQKKMKDKNIVDQEKKAAEDCQGYIHVRARRGQATDSHSLAERVRRERISERMKLLQALVPGCEKVTGKALMLDEIINYVQSLQNQVEFLSMKLASVNPMFYDFGMDFEPFMVRPDQECSPTTANNYGLLDNAPNNSLMFQQAQIPNTLPQGHIEVLSEMDGQRQKIINQSGINNSSFSFY